MHEPLSPWHYRINQCGLLLTSLQIAERLAPGITFRTDRPPEGYWHSRG